MSRHVRSLALLLSLVVAACGGTPQPQSAAATESACEAEFRRAAARDNTLGRGRGLDEAIRVCKSLEEWTAASQAHPDALDGVDPETILRNECRNGFLKYETLCSSVLP